MVKFAAVLVFTALLQPSAASEEQEQEQEQSEPCVYPSSDYADCSAIDQEQLPTNAYDPAACVAKSCGQCYFDHSSGDGPGGGGTCVAFGGVSPTTSRINKPLLALALTSAGFVPLEADDACVCDVASGADGGVSVAFVDGAYSFSETELESQRLSVVPDLVDGRRVTLHANYAPPPNFGHAAVELRGDGAECRRWLTGKLSLFVE